MNELFMTFYENWCGIYDANYSEVFQVLWETKAYRSMGLMLMLVPLIFNMLFYYAFQYPYCNRLHWLITQGIAAVIVFCLAWLIANRAIETSETLELLFNNQDLNYNEFVNTWFYVKYGLYSAIASIIVGFVSSVPMKIFSCHNKHIPF